MKRKGSKFSATNAIQTSVGNDELIPVGGQFLKISFSNLTGDCLIKVNGVEMFLQSGTGFDSNYDDPIIKSFIVVTPGVQYLYIATE